MNYQWFYIPIGISVFGLGAVMGSKWTQASSACERIAGQDRVAFAANRSVCCKGGVCRTLATDEKSYKCDVFVSDFSESPRYIVGCE